MEWVESDDDSDSSLELFDINPQVAVPVFEYNDRLSLSPQLEAVVLDDVPRLHALLQGGKSVNINDNLGNTPLHVAVLTEKRKIFDYLLRVSDIRLDVENFELYTPLMIAASLQDEYYTLELLKKKVDVNVICNTDDTPLHFAMDSNNEKIVEALIKSGADINYKNCKGDTPLHRACTLNSVLIPLILYYGADVGIENRKGEIGLDISMLNCPFEVQEMLYNYTFDESGGNDVNLKTVTLSMTKDSPLFSKLIERNHVTYTVYEIIALQFDMVKIRPQIFKVFMDKYDDVAERLFCGPQSYHLLNHFFASNLAETPLEFLYMLCESRFVLEIIAQSSGTFKQLYHRKIPEEDAHLFVCTVLSYGYELSPYELYTLFWLYGYGDLFTVLLHMDIPPIHHPVCPDQPNSLMAAVIHDCTVSRKILFMFDWPRRNCTKQLKQVFRHPSLGLPSLVELARNAARRYLISRFDVRRSVQFFTILKALPINQVYKDIISYKRPLYR